MSDLAPLEWDENAPDFEIPQWKNLNFSSVPAAQMSRHFMILGETGSGKTKSAIIPIMRSIVRTKINGKRASALVIDPKNELYNHVKGEPGIISYNQILLEEGSVIDFFEGDRSQLTVDIVKSKIIQLFLGESDPTHFFWDQQRDITFSAFLKIDFHEYQKGNLDRLNEFWTGFTSYALIQELNHLETDLSGNKVLKQNVNPASYAALGEIRLKCEWNNKNYFARFLCLVNNPYALQHFLNYWQQSSPECQITESYQQLQQLAQMGIKGVEGQLAGVVGNVNNLLIRLTAQELIDKINFNPFQVPSNYISVAELMDNGQWLVYSPNQNSEIEDLTARCIKAKFFDFTFKRRDKERPFTYICDEFQRFITNDRQSGEQSYLDRCRAYRAICVLATQSLASLTYTMQSSGQAKVLAESSLNILLNNTGNKFFFRNTDIDTIEKLSKLIPQAYTRQKPHVISVRPPSTLKAGECYYLLSDSRWGRAMVDL